MPSLAAADATFDALEVVSGERVTVGPILLGAAKPARILTPTSTARPIVNLTALAAVDAAAPEIGVAPPERARKPHSEEPDHELHPD